jgi:Binding domain of Nse4/EID3 to Nse3-MAGE
VNLTDRDRKLLLIIVPLVVVVAYWFLLLSPKREEASQANDAVAAAKSERDQAVALADKQSKARETFERDYTEIVRLGKAVPSSVNMPSLLVQLDRAATGTSIDFNKITVGERAAVAPAAGAPEGSAPEGDGSQPASAPGEAAQAAEGAKADSEQSAQESDAASDGDAAAAPAAAAPAASPPGLDVVQLQLTFTGTFFDLADFMHRLKRYVRVRGEGVAVRGRLMRIESLKLTPKEGSKLAADMVASVYLSPKAEGETAGASPQGPAPQSTPASGAPPASSPDTASVAR